MICIRTIEHNSTDYQQMVELRYEILRKPLGLSFSLAELAQEKQEILIGAFMEDQLVGCCILTKQNEKVVKLRQMAVDSPKQGIGIGESLLLFAEDHARQTGHSTLCMNARKTAIGFYEKLSYSVKGNEFLEVRIPHLHMVKTLR